MEEKFKPYFYIAFILVAILLFFTLFPNGLNGGLSVTQSTPFQLGIITLLTSILIIGLVFFFVKSIKIKAIIGLVLGLFVLFFTIIFLLIIPLVTNPNPMLDVLGAAAIMLIGSISGLVWSVQVLFFKKKE